MTLINGTLQGSGSVTIANQLILGGGYVSFSGASAINFNQSALSFAPTNTVVGTANLIANSASTTTINDSLGGSGNLTLFSGTGTLALTGNDNFFGAATVNGGTLSLSGASGQLADASQIAHQCRRRVDR